MCAGRTFSPSWLSVVRIVFGLVVAFHWLGGTADNVANGGGVLKGPFYGLWELAEGSTIFVAPQGIDNAWPDDGRTNTMEGQDSSSRAR